MPCQQHDTWYLSCPCFQSFAVAASQDKQKKQSHHKCMQYNKQTVGHISSVFFVKAYLEKSIWKHVLRFTNSYLPSLPIPTWSQANRVIILVVTVYCAGGTPKVDFISQKFTNLEFSNRKNIFCPSCSLPGWET